MIFLGKEIGELPKLYVCDCCSRFMWEGETAVILAYRDSNELLVFQWHCLECEGVGA